MNIKMLTKLRRMNEHKISVVRKHEEEPNRAKEYKTEMKIHLSNLTAHQRMQKNGSAIQKTGQQKSANWNSKKEKKFF